MLRYEDINEISDGKIYSAEDIVQIDTDGCNGCSHCCESDMGHSIVLTPYDIYQMTAATGMSFDDLLVGYYIEMSMIDGIVLPNLKMDQGCRFLENGRCSIHQHRPGICRLFPLGRIYQDSGFGYFIQVGECPKADKGDVRISDWLGIDRLDDNTRFINKWHGFVKYEMKKISEIREMSGYEIQRLRSMDEGSLVEYAGIMDEAELLEQMTLEEYTDYRIDAINEETESRIKSVMTTVLGYFYLDPYDSKEDFYIQFDRRLRSCLGSIRYK